ncbi:MAG: acyltransferase family protein, partial [Culicoidibacterales bacterium]
MKKRYDALDILRFFLASLVIIGHFLTSYKYGTNLDAHISIFDFPFYLKPLGRAVDVFFVLSGFTMAYSTMRPQSSSAFLQKRFARILPLYLIVTIIAIILFSFFPYIDSEGRTYSLDFILNSLIMRPTEQHFPVVTAWTLAYEMLFYVVFAICMSISHKYRVVIATVFLSFSMYFAAVCTYPNFGYLSTLMTPNFFFLEFIAGMWIGLYADKIKIHHGWILCFIGATISYMLIYTDAYASLYRGLYFVLPSALIILGAISIKVPKSNLKLTRKLGDISYTMYITHVFTGFTFPVILRKVFHWDEYSFLLTLIALVMTITISLYVNKFIEKPLYKYLTKTLIELKKPKISRVSIKKYFPVLIILCCLVFDFSMTKALDNRPAWKATRIISNKGSAEEIGNTLAAYDLAIKYGTQYIELDVVTSKTGTLYISHDLSAKNLTGVNKLFGDMTNEEIDQLRINKSSQEKIELLKLQDVITRYTDTINYVIDLKEDTKQVP